MLYPMHQCMTTSGRFPWCSRAASEAQGFRLRNMAGNQNVTQVSSDVLVSFPLKSLLTGSGWCDQKQARYSVEIGPVPVDGTWLLLSSKLWIAVLLMLVNNSRYVPQECHQGRISDSLVLRAGEHHDMWHQEDSAALLSCRSHRGELAHAEMSTADPQLAEKA